MKRNLLWANRMGTALFPIVTQNLLEGYLDVFTTDFVISRRK
jgi:hypothetical protein